jgi:hypothetical protein
VAHVPGTGDQAGERGGGTLADEGVDKRQVARLVGAGVVGIAALSFIVQNSERIETTFLLFSVETRQWVSLVVALILGIALGLLIPVIRRRGDDD